MVAPYLGMLSVVCHIVITIISVVKLIRELYWHFAFLLIPPDSFICCDCHTFPRTSWLSVAAGFFFSFLSEFVLFPHTRL